MEPFFAFTITGAKLPIVTPSFRPVGLARITVNVI
jgi:hypothetical protein